MLTHPNGKIVLEQAVSRIDLSMFSRIIVTILQQHVDSFDADVWLDQMFGHAGVEVCVLSEDTASQSETIGYTIKKMGITGAFVAKDSDGLICAPTSLLASGSNFVVGGKVSDFPRISNLPAKSFITLNEQGALVDIIEKEMVSDVISLGCYGFESAQSFCERLEVLSREWPVSREIYPSHIIASMLGQGDCFEFVRATEYEDYGTLADFQVVQKNYKTLFVDLDGVIFENKGKYGKRNWFDGQEVVIDENIAVLRAMIASGCQVVFCTARDESCRDLVESSLDRLGLQFHGLIMGLHHTQRIIINDFSNSNPWPSCVAINVERDSSSLSDYLSGFMQ